jgi:hypothetical protein
MSMLMTVSASKSNVGVGATVAIAGVIISVTPAHRVSTASRNSAHQRHRLRPRTWGDRVVSDVSCHKSDRRVVDRGISNNVGRKLGRKKTPQVLLFALNTVDDVRAQLHPFSPARRTVDLAFGCTVGTNTLGGFSFGAILAIGVLLRGWRCRARVVPILDAAIDVLLLAGSAVVALRADLGAELVID